MDNIAPYLLPSIRSACTIISVAITLDNELFAITTNYKVSSDSRDNDLALNRI